MFKQRVVYIKDEKKNTNFVEIFAGKCMDE